MTTPIDTEALEAVDEALDEAATLAAWVSVGTPTRDIQAGTLVKNETTYSSVRITAPQGEYTRGPSQAPRALLSAGNKVFLMGAAENAFTPKVNDFVQINGRKWKVESVNEIRAVDDVVAYEIEVTF